MRVTSLSLVLILSAPLVAAAETPPSPYVGLEQRTIKALSAGDIEGYLAGRGMGLALPAELNGYPGPQHVPELAAELALTAEQQRRTRASFDAMHERAVALGRRLVKGERALDLLFAHAAADPERMRAQVTANAAVLGELRLCHLEAHLDMKRILSEAQVRAYFALRGYAVQTPERPGIGEPGCPHAR